MQTVHGGMRAKHKTCSPCGGRMRARDSRKDLVPYTSRLISNKGFTLFELIIAIAIVGLIMGIVVSRTDQFLELDMKKASNRLASTIRYLYNKSVTEGTYLRIVLDLNEQSYWVEATNDPLLMTTADMTTDKKKDSSKAKEEEKKKEEEEELQTDTTLSEADTASDLVKDDQKGQLPKLEIKEPTFSPVESYLLKPVKLPGSVFFKDVASEHQPVPQEGGQATINFFPNGYVERAIINLRNEDDDIYYSLETNPVTGRVNITNEYRTFEK